MCSWVSLTFHVLDAQNTSSLESGELLLSFGVPPRPINNKAFAKEGGQVLEVDNACDLEKIRPDEIELGR